MGLGYALRSPNRYDGGGPVEPAYNEGVGSHTTSQARTKPSHCGWGTQNADELVHIASWRTVSREDESPPRTEVLSVVAVPTDSGLSIVAPFFRCWVVLGVRKSYWGAGQ